MFEKIKELIITLVLSAFLIVVSIIGLGILFLVFSLIVGTITGFNLIEVSRGFFQGL